MSAEQSILSRIENTIEAPAPAPKVEAAQNDDLPDLDDPSGPALDDPEPPAVEGDEVDDSVELELGGEVRKVSKAELKELAEAGRTYKQTAESLTQQRAAVERERAIVAHMQQIAPQVESIRAEGRLLLNAMQGLNQEVQTLTESDPIAAFQKQQLLNQYQTRFNQLAQAEGQVSAQMSHAQQLLQQQQLAAELPKLIEKLPNWKDPAKAASDQKFIRTYMEKEGYSPQEVAMASRSHYVVTLLKAAKYDALREKQASKKVEGAPQMARSGSAVLPGQRAATDKLNYRKAIKSASTDADKARIIQKRLEATI